MWPRLAKGSVEWNLEGAKTFDYSDLPLVVNLTGGQTLGGVKGLGPVGMRTAWNVTGQFTAAYLDWLLRGKNLQPVQGLVGLYPEMKPYIGNASESTAEE
jgi:hypothetical protein